jgi:hypothetical protein
MEIGSVGATAGAPQQQPVSARSQPQDDRTRVRAEAVESQENAQAQGAQERPPQATERPEQPRVFVNAQGQKTGTIINVTA